jgi:hypothetical protein
VPEPGLRFAFVSQYVPPSPSGQSTVIGRLIGDWPPDSYRLVSLTGEPQIPRGSRFGIQVPNALLAIAVRARRIGRTLRAESCQLVIGATGDPYDLPAACLASRRARVPFVAYYFDDYALQPWHAVTRWVARRLEPLFLRRAARVIVPNEAMSGELRRRHGIECVVVRNPCDVGAYRSKIEPRAGSTRIVFTGAVAESNYGGFRNLLAAIEGTPYRLHVYTAQRPESLRAEGIEGPVEFHEHLPPEEMPRIQQDADILFLPLSLDSRYPELIRTSAPAKLGEYLASGRPILAHVPADSFVAAFLNEHQCGTVVSDPAGLRAALGRIRHDPAASDRARGIAQSEFSMEGSRARFLGVLREAAAS